MIVLQDIGIVKTMIQQKEIQYKIILNIDILSQYLGDKVKKEQTNEDKSNKEHSFQTIVRTFEIFILAIVIMANITIIITIIIFILKPI